MVQRGPVISSVAWWPAFFHSEQPFDRALGAAATLAVSLAVLRLVRHALRHDDETDVPSSFSILKGLLRTFLVASNDSSGVALEWMVHRGSCHCNAIQFELVAPKQITALHGKGKIQFPHSRTKATNFRLLKGTDHLKMYYVNVPSKGRGVEPVTAAHSFCCQCGVNILHAPDSLSTELDVNVSCLDKSSHHETFSKQNLLSGGFPVPGQWSTSHTAIRNDQFGLVSDDEDDEFDVQHDSGINLGTQQQQAECQPRPVPQECPGTPSTIGTSATETVTSRLRPFGLDHASVASSDDFDSIVGSTSLGHPLTRARPVGGCSVASGRSIMSEATTPIIRNQLKQYMSKHLVHNDEPVSSKVIANGESKPKD